MYQEGPMSENVLNGLRVLVVEDDYLLAQELCAGLQDSGAQVLGPFPSLEQAMPALDDPKPTDCAVLDINLGGEVVYPLADILLEKNIPLLFATSYSNWSLPERYNQLPKLEKPVDSKVLAHHLSVLIAQKKRKRPSPQIANKLLSQLPASQFDRIKEFFDEVELNAGETLIPPGADIEHIYFPLSGIALKIADPDRGRIEVGMIGAEGSIGASFALGVHGGVYSYLIQHTGTALRMALKNVETAFRLAPALRRLLMYYSHILTVQAAEAARANANHSIDVRLARWLLMTADRLGDNTIPITHTLLSDILGVRRAGITNATHILEGEGLIRAARNILTIRDNEKLKEYAGKSYGIAEQEYERLFVKNKNSSKFL